MKKKDLFNLLISVVVVIALTFIYIFTDISETFNNIIEYLIYGALLVMYLLCSKITYERIKDKKDYIKTFKKTLLLYILVCLLYSTLTLLNISILSFILMGLFFCGVFMFAVTFTSYIYKIVEDNNKVLRNKTLVILGISTIISMLLFLLFAYVILPLDGLTSILVYVIRVCFNLISLSNVTCICSLVIISMIYIFKKLVFIK